MNITYAKSRGWIKGLAGELPMTLARLTQSVVHPVQCYLRKRRRYKVDSQQAEKHRASPFSVSEENSMPKEAKVTLVLSDAPGNFWTERISAQQALLRLANFVRQHPDGTCTLELCTVGHIAAPSINTDRDEVKAGKERISQEAT